MAKEAAPETAYESGHPYTPLQVKARGENWGIYMLRGMKASCRYLRSHKLMDNEAYLALTYAIDAAIEHIKRKQSTRNPFLIPRR